MEQPSPSATQIAKIVGAIGKRAALARSLPLATIAIAGGLTGFSLILALTRATSSGLLIAAVGLTLLAVLAIAIWSWRRSGNLGRIARRADIRLQLNETLSTAIGLAPASQNAVTRALEAYASNVASRIDIGRAIPLFTRSTALALAMLTLAIFGASAAYSLIGPTPPSPPAEAETAEPAAEDAIAADDIDILAKLIADDAKRRDSDYLKAVANSLQELAQAARDGTPAPAIAGPAQNPARSRRRWLRWPHARLDVGQYRRCQCPYRQCPRLQPGPPASRPRRQQAQANQPASGGSSADMYDLPEDRLLRSAGTPPPGSQPPPDHSQAGEREGGPRKR
jgi:plasmid stabilization system protein ParE